MAKTQTITFTALPNGVAPSGKLRLSVFVSPRLWTDDGASAQVALSEFPDWLDWPATALTFQAQFGGGSPIAATRVGDAPRSDLWQALFAPTSYLRPRTFETALTQTTIKSYKVQAVHQKLQTVYTYFAKNNPEEYPTVDELLDVNGPFYDLAAPFIPPPPPPPGPIIKSIFAGPSTDYLNFKEVEDFHKPFNPNNRIDPAPPDIEFHQMLAALGRYPVLMRMLGIVHDLEVAHPGGLGATTVQVLASWPGAPTLPALLTRCFVGASAFFATPRGVNPELSLDGLGMLPLGDGSAYELVQVNQDGAVLKTLRFAETIVRATFDPADTTNYPGQADTTEKVYKTDDTPGQYAIPALSTAGLAVARVDRAAAVTANLAASATNNTALEGGSVTLDAEDLVRGYAIDVHDATSGAWRSLCERVGTYRFGGTSLPAVQDEGFVSMGLAGPADGSSTDTKLGETLFNWWGWSLAAPRPGKTIDADGNPVAPQNTPTTQFELQVDFKAKPGSLPRLRHGETYRLRARAVDLAGNRTPREALAGLTNATAAVTFGRFEPVASPEVVLDGPLGEGDAVARVVIRSNYDGNIEQEAVRHIAPPKAAEPTVETTGLFDTPGGFDRDAYRLLEDRDGGAWVDVGTEDPHHPGVFFVKQQDGKLPYLPDGLARGTVWRGLPGASGATRVAFGSQGAKGWPDIRAFDLVLREGSGAPAYRAAPRRLEVRLGKGDIATVRLSSYLDPDLGDVDRMALLRWMEANEPASVPTFRQQVADGVHWMVTPYRTLTLVHAVRQPLLRPRFVGLGATRALGDTFALLDDAAMELSRKSTGRLDLLATWNETIDSLAQPGPIETQGSARPFIFNVPLAATPAQETALHVSGRHEFHDTRYRRVSYAADATSRFAEYFAERKDREALRAYRAVQLNAPVKDDGIDWGGVVEGSEAVVADDRSTRYVRGTDYTMDYAKGTLTPLASLDGKSVSITFLAPPVVRRTAAPTDLDIPSTARPAAPKVLYLVPTFGWSSTASRDGTLFTSERRGGGLRAYVERPWFSSGDGELLGVVIWSGATPPPDAAKPFVSDWGLDPLYSSGATTPAPTVGAFTMATASKTSGLSLEELPGVTTLHVAGHQVGYDAERKLWYCDLEIDAGPSYTPFVRLAFARYQPHSVNGAHLSRVQLADFVQLAADRSASLTRDPKKSDTLSLTVSGRSYSKLVGAGGPSTVEVSLERRRANTEPNKAAELAWELVPASTVALTPSAGPSGTTLWQGQLTLPKAQGDRFRVVIAEFERFSATPGDRRLVYTDAIEVQR